MCLHHCTKLVTLRFKFCNTLADEPAKLHSAPSVNTLLQHAPVPTLEAFLCIIAEALPPYAAERGAW